MYLLSSVVFNAAIQYTPLLKPSITTIEPQYLFWNLVKSPVASVGHLINTVFNSTSRKYGQVLTNVCIYVKMMNDKIGEIKFDIKERVERRDDIDLIYKTFPSITLMLQDKDSIIHISDSDIKTANAKRSHGMTFEMVRPKMTHISILVVLIQIFI